MSQDQKNQWKCDDLSRGIAHMLTMVLVYAHLHDWVIKMGQMVGFIFQHHGWFIGVYNINTNGNGRHEFFLLYISYSESDDDDDDDDDGGGGDDDDAAADDDNDQLNICVAVSILCVNCIGQLTSVCCVTFILVGLSLMMSSYEH